MAAEQLDDPSLLREIQQGCHHAFETLVKRHHRRFYQLAYRYTNNEHEAQDMVQTAFLKLWQTPFHWDPRKQTAFTTWFYRLVINLCLDANKKQRSLPLPDTDDIIDDTAPLEKQIELSKQKHQLQQAIRQLPDRQKTALILCVYQENSHQDAAHIMDIPLPALRSLLSRAKSQLKAVLSTHLQKRNPS